MIIYCILVFWSFVCLFPIYWLAITSLKSENDVTAGPYFIPFIDFSPNLRAWYFLFSYNSENFYLRFINSILIAGLATALTLIASVFLLYGLTRSKGRKLHPRLQRGIVVGMLATRLLPPVVIVLPLYFLAQKIGLLDTHLFLIFVYAAMNLPVAVWLLLPVVGTRPSDQEDAANLDGASAFRVLWDIFLPLILRSVWAIGFLVFVLCWNEYLLAAHLAGDTAMTLPPWMVGQLSIKEAQVGSEAEEWANLSAAAMLMMMPLLIGTVAAQRFLSRQDIWHR